MSHFPAHGITLQLMRFLPSVRRERLSALFRDARLLFELRFGRYDFLVLNSGASLLKRPALLRRLTSIARHRQIPTFVLWRNAKIKFAEIEKALGGKRYASAMQLLGDPRLHHLAISEQTASDIVEVLGVARPRCVLNCPDIPAHYLEPRSPLDPPIVLNVASLAPRKDPGTFVRIARAVCDRHPSVRFKWVGAEASAQLSDLVKQLRLEDRLEFVAFTDKPFDYMQECSLFLLTSQQEGFGLVLAEAMACSRTVLCVEGTGAAEVAGDTGLVMKPGDISGAAEAVIELVSRPAAERINSAARDRYLAEYSPDAYARRFADIIRSALASG